MLFEKKKNTSFFPRLTACKNLRFKNFKENVLHKKNRPTPKKKTPGPKSSASKTSFTPPKNNHPPKRTKSHPLPSIHFHAGSTGLGSRRLALFEIRCAALHLIGTSNLGVECCHHGGGASMKRPNKTNNEWTRLDITPPGSHRCFSRKYMEIL